MTDLRQAATQALKALDKLSKLGNGNQDGNSLGNTIAQEAREHLFTALAQPEQEPTCPECKAAVLYECVACSSNNYPPRPEQEPTGYWDGKFSKDGGATLYEVPQESMFGRKYPNIPLYATPPAAQRTWVGLDEDEIRELYGKDLNYRDGNYVRYAMAVEAKLKERNT